ncbi:hypothetical protein H0H92_004419, partial [Tricholoma furcatifolium]
MEAEVSSAGEEDDDEESDDFINDVDSESDEDIPPPAFQQATIDEDEWTDDERLDFSEPTLASHAAVMQLMTVEEANEAFNAYLELEERRQLQRQNEEPHPDDRHSSEVQWEKIPEGIVPLLPRPDSDKFLWRVSVMRGREESLAFILYRKALMGNFNVQSVIGRVSCPGWVYVEAKEYRHVQQLCQDVRDIHVERILRIPPHEAPSILREPPFIHPAKGSWVRLTHHKLYHGDLGWVSDHKRGMTIEVIVVPRLDPNLKRKRRDRDEPLHVSSLRSLRHVERPSQRILDMQPLMEPGCPGVIEADVWMHRLDKLPEHWAGPVGRVPTNELDQYNEDGRVIMTTCVYRGRLLYNGFHVITTRHYEPTIPTIEELHTFK